MQKGIIKLKNQPAIISCSSVVGKQEFEGPLKEYFDFHDEDDKFGQKTWEKSESEMQHIALNLALSKIKLTIEDIDAIFAGDLMNQCTSSAYGLLDFDVPYFGLYGACSTMAEGLIIGSLLTDSKYFNKCAVISSSHYCSAERQFRFPLEYGGQRTPTSQWTVTGSGAFILSDNKVGPYITEVLPGRTIDKGIKDVSNMGAAMAPAAIDTLSRYFKQSKLSPDVFDLIVTGDLGSEGKDIVLDMLKADNIDLQKNYDDCGLMIYNRELQDMHAGGSGCGCSSVVLASYIMEQFKIGNIKDMLIVGTGALMSPGSLQQGCSIPGVAHLVRISRERINNG